jgi:NAD(P)H-quinone oxidoreductase subunit 5
MLSYLPATFACLASAIVMLTMFVRPIVRPQRTQHVDALVVTLLGFGAMASIAAIPFATRPSVLRLGHIDMFDFTSVIGLSFLVDRVTLAMLAAICVVGLVVYRFSTRYLLGEVHQGRFLGWLGFTLGAVELLVISGHLILFALAWVLVSVGLHRLLVHYDERPRAILAAQTKFVVSRLGDLGLLFASVVLALEFRTLDLAELLAEARGPLSVEAQEALGLAGLGLALAAICKSAQVPFHSWLPDTLEAPTPVSALMHAGIVNAGGFLLVRTSPLLAHAPVATSLLVIVGVVTAAVGTLAMRTQSEVKRALAWSTVGQMGFMVLQCGLGAFAGALVHLVGHGFYKACAFLGSGELSNARPTRGGPARPLHAMLGLGAGIVFGGAGLIATYVALDIDPATEPGGLVLVGTMALGLAAWFVPTDGQPYAPFVRFACAAATTGLVVATATLANNVFHADVGVLPSLLERGAFGVVLTVFVFVVACATAIHTAIAPALAREGIGAAFYVASRQGFYLGHFTSRVARALFRSRPIPPIALRGEPA